MSDRALYSGDVSNPFGDASPLRSPIYRPPWVDPPEQWTNIDLLAYVALPAIGTQANILSFQVPLGQHGVIKAVGNNFVGGGWVEGSGAASWQILIDGAPPPGSTSYDNILASLGSPANPTRIAGFRIFENQVLTMVIRNPAVGGIVVAGQLSGGRLLGWLYPKEMEDANLWI